MLIVHDLILKASVKIHYRFGFTGLHFLGFRSFEVIFFSPFHQVRAQGSTEEETSGQRSESKRIFGISSSSRIGWIMHSYLRLIPGIANNPEKLAETTELFDDFLKLELLDHFERMTTKKRMSTESMQQWLAGAAFHLHMRIHQVRRDKKKKPKSK